jgi:hypothetical protein
MTTGGALELAISFSCIGKARGSFGSAALTHDIRPEPVWGMRRRKWRPLAAAPLRGAQFF